MCDGRHESRVVCAARLSRNGVCVWIVGVQYAPTVRTAPTCTSRKATDRRDVAQNWNISNGHKPDIIDVCLYIILGKNRVNRTGTCSALQP